MVATHATHDLQGALMNPIFQWIVSHTVMKTLARECPSCRRTQVVPSSRVRDTVSCKHCGSAIPPKQRSDER